jgi:hypothetical protein
MRALNDVLGKLPPARQGKVEARAQELIAEELTLQGPSQGAELTDSESRDAVAAKRIWPFRTCSPISCGFNLLHS